MKAKCHAYSTHLYPVADLYDKNKQCKADPLRCGICNKTLFFCRKHIPVIDSWHDIFTDHGDDVKLVWSYTGALRHHIMTCRDIGPVIGKYVGLCDSDGDKY